MRIRALTVLLVAVALVAAVPAIAGPGQPPGHGGGGGHPPGHGGGGHPPGHGGGHPPGHGGGYPYYPYGYWGVNVGWGRVGLGRVVGPRVGLGSVLWVGLSGRLPGGAGRWRGTPTRCCRYGHQTLNMRGCFSRERLSGSRTTFDGYPDYLYLKPGHYTLEFQLQGYASQKIEIDSAAGRLLPDRPEAGEGQGGEGRGLVRPAAGDACGPRVRPEDSSRGGTQFRR